MTPSPAPAFACPPVDLLTDFGRGLLPDVECVRIADHLGVCDACARISVEPDPFSLRLRNRLRGDGDASSISSHDPECSALENRAKAFRVMRTESALEGDTDEPSQLKVPSQLGQYQIVAKIGRGGMGMVYKAFHVNLEQTVALKVIAVDRLRNARAIVRFEREWKALGRLVHPNIVRASDAGQVDGHRYLVMEHVDGIDLSALVKQRGPCSVPDAISYVLQAARGLEFAHGLGVVHRDVKPANLLVDTSGVVKVLDLGLARLELGDEAGERADATDSGAVLGTADYMSPEQAFNTKHADARTDIYGLGCTLHYLLMAKVIYDGETTVEKILAHRDKPIPSLRELRADVPQSLDAIFQKMVAKKVEDRYPSMRDVVADLERCAAGHDPACSSGGVNPQDARGNETLKAAPPQRIAKPGFYGRFINNRPLWIGAGGAGFVALLFGVLIIVRNEKGEKVANIEIPAGHSVEVQPTRAKPEKPARRDGNAAPVKTAIAWREPAFQQWMQDVARLPAPKQVEAVASKLQELNPDFDGKVQNAITEDAITGDVVTLLMFRTDHVTDVSPVRALVGLKELACQGSGSDKGQLSDLSPLQGMRLTTLQLFGNKLSDLTPLQGLPLTSLQFGWTQVSDLSPLRGMPLKQLTFPHTRVSDLLPLKDMPLTHLQCSKTRVTDLSPLRGLKLIFLDCDTNEVSDLSPLEGMPLQVLYISRTPVADLSPLRGMPLWTFNCMNTQVTDLSPLKGLLLKSLDCSSNRISDLTPLEECKNLQILQAQATQVTAAGVAALQKILPNCKIEWGPHKLSKPPEPAATVKPLAPWGNAAFQQWVKEVAPLSPLKQADAVYKKLKELNPGISNRAKVNIDRGLVTGLEIRSTALTDLSPLRALPGLKSFRYVPTEQGQSSMSDLSPLQGLQLTTLWCDHTEVSDLSALQGMPLTALHCNFTKVADLSSLRGLPLTELMCAGTLITDLTPLKELPLTVLSCGDTKVSDLSALRPMKLAYLACDRSQVADLSFLKGMPLRHLIISSTRVVDLAPLRGMSLTTLDCSKTQIVDLSPLAGMPLTSLQCYETPVSDLSSLGGTPLARLFCSSCKIRDLSRLSDCKNLQYVQANATPIDTAGVAALQADLPNCKIDWDDPAKMPAPARPIADWREPAFQQWIKDVAQLAAGKQAEAVIRKLQELNPRFDGKVATKIEDDAVTELKFITDKVTDLSPVRALPELKVLHCGWNHEHKAVLKDLTPLHGMQLTELSIGRTKVSDLSPLQGMNLRVLGCSWTPVSDLSPLRGMPLEKLNCDNTRVSDLSPIQGAPLVALNCGGTRVHDLAPLRQMSLRSLITYTTPVSDLSPLRGMPLDTLRIESTLASDLSPLQGMRLLNLWCDNSLVSDLSPLQGMRLIHLNMTSNRISDLTPLENCKSLRHLYANATKVKSADVAALQAALPNCKIDWDDPTKPKTNLSSSIPRPVPLHNDAAFLQWLKEVASLSAEDQVDALAKKLQELNPAFDGKVAHHWIENNVVTEIKFTSDDLTDLSPLRALPRLKWLHCAGGVAKRGKLSDLSPLRGLPLSTLNCSITQVSDLSPLEGMPLKFLSFATTNVYDLSPLEGMQLTSLDCRGMQTVDPSPLLGMPLKCLQMSGSFIPVAMLREFPLLEMLAVDHNQVGRLPLLQRLHTIELDQADEPSLEILSNLALPELAEIYLMFPKQRKASLAACTALQQAFPACEIKFVDPDVPTPIFPHGSAAPF